MIPELGHLALILALSTEAASQVNADAVMFVIARVSASGQPFEQPGDWYGSATLVTAETNSLSLVIDRRVSKP